MTIVQVASAYGAGLLASLSPCIYPLIPITLGFLGSQANDKKRFKISLLMFLLGQILVFTALGILTVQLGETLGFTAENPWVQLSLAIFLGTFGVFSFFGQLPAFLEKINTKSQGLRDQGAKTPLASLVTGMGSALLTSPCTTPILSGILALISSTQDLYKGSFLMFIYSLGFVSLLAILGLGFAKAQNLPRAGEWLNRIHKFSAVVLILMSVYYAYNGVSGLI